MINLFLSVVNKDILHFEFNTFLNRSNLVPTFKNLKQKEQES